MSNLPSSLMIDIVLEEQENKRLKFFKEMNEFPCSFNLGNCNLSIGSTRYACMKLFEPDLPKSKWEFLRYNLTDDDDDTEFEQAVWKENLLTRVHAEVGDLHKAFELNKKIRGQYGKSNLVALANAAFLFFHKSDLDKAYKIIDGLKKLKTELQFDDLRLGAVCEQGYTFRKFGGAKNLLCAISLLKFALSFIPFDERLRFMLAMVYRRCTHFNIYTEDPKNINRNQLALKAAINLSRLGNSARSQAVRSAAFVELAYLKFHDDIIEEKKRTDEQTILSRTQWFDIVGEKDWRQLCTESVEVGGDNLPEKVLKIAGQLFRYFDTDEDLNKSEQFLIKAIEEKSTNRAHHHLGLTYKQMAVKFEQKGNRNSSFQRDIQSTMQCSKTSQLKTLPSINGSAPKLDNHLKYVTKVPAVEIEQFKKDNPSTSKAIKHFNLASELSCFQNRPAVYDLAIMLLQTGNYSKSKAVCNILIAQYATAKTICYDYPVCLVNACNLYGICCLKEAEKVAEANKEHLLADGEEKLILTVRLASHLAAEVPELATCATDLWNAFKTLKRQFTFEGQKESRKKLFRLCELVNDYRCLEAIDEILSQDPAEWGNMEVIEECLKRYLSMGALDSALLLRDMIQLYPDVNSKVHKSNVFKQLILQVAEKKLDSTYARTDGELYIPDPVWKQLLCEEFQEVNNSKVYDIAIVDDVTVDWEPERGSESDSISRNMKKALQGIFDLKVVRAHEEVYPGTLFLEEQLKIISRSHVVIFVLTQPYDKPHSIESNMHPDSISRIYEYIINSCVDNYLNKEGAKHMIVVSPDNLQHKDLPQTVRSLINLRLLKTDIDLLAMYSQGRGSGQFPSLIKKIFRALLNKPQPRQ